VSIGLFGANVENGVDYFSNDNKKMQLFFWDNCVGKYFCLFAVGGEKSVF